MESSSNDLTKPVAVVMLVAVILPLGFVAHNLVLLDTMFAAGYLVLETLGQWRPGPSWVVENRACALICFFAIPVVVSMLLSIAIVFAFDRIKRRSIFWAAVFCLVAAAALILVQSSPADRISYFGYWTANY